MTAKASRLSLWRKFMSIYPDKVKSIEGIFRLLRNVPFHCMYCNHTEFERKYGSIISRCKSCRGRNWLLSRTIFAGSRRYQAWLGAIWMMMRGAQLDSKTLEELAGIAQSTALNIISTIRLALTMTAEPNGFETALSRAFIPTFKKRSRKTPADGRPWEEENEFESSECASSAPERVEKSESTLANETHLSLHLNQHEQFIYSLLSSEPVHFDSLCEQSGRPPGEVSAALMMLELEGLCRSTSFNCFARIQNCAQLAAATDVRGPLPECITDAVEAASAFINLYHRGISRKYVQLYLMDHAYQTTKSIKTKIRWIIGACWRAGPIGHPDLLRYVSPRTVEFAALPKSTREAAI